MKSRLVKSEFLKNVLTLVSGTTFAQILTLLALPVLTRVYGTFNYTILGVYTTASSIFMLFATLQYTQSIILPEKKEESSSLLYLCLVSSFFVSIISYFVVLFLNQEIASYLEKPSLAKWLILVPIGVLIDGCNKSLIVWANRNKKYPRIAFARIIGTSVTVSISMSIGIYYFLNFGKDAVSPMGLILAYVIGQGMSASFLLIKTFKKDRNLLTPFSWKKSIIAAKKYKKFSLFVLPSELINVLTLKMPIIFLSKFASKDAVALFENSNRVLGYPILFISSAITEVFRQKATQTFHEIGNCKQLFLKTLRSLFTISIVPFLVLIFFGPVLFAFVFGEEWREAGEFARIMGIMFMFKFITSPLSYLYFIVGKQREDFILHVYLLFSTIAAFYIGFTVFKDNYTALWLYALNYTFVYLIYLFRTYQFSKGKIKIDSKNNSNQ